MGGVGVHGAGGGARVVGPVEARGARGVRGRGLETDFFKLLGNICFFS